MSEENAVEQVEDLNLKLNQPPPVANPLIPRLVDLCLNTIIENFTKDECSKLHLIPRKYQTKVLTKLSLDIDLKRAVMTIPDGVYWKRKVQSEFPRVPHDPKLTQWKRFYLEIYASKALESDSEAGLDKFFDEMPVIAPFIRRLDIKRSPAKVKLLKLFNCFRGLLQLSMVYGDPRRNFAVYEDFDNFKMEDEMSASVQDCNLIRDALTQVGPCCALEEFTMTDNCLSDKCAQIIGFGLVNLRNLTHITFSHNEIGNKGFNNLVQCLKSAPIRYIDVSDNRIGGSGVQSLANALEKNTTLEHLDLSSNKLADKGMFGISMIIQKTQSLKYLDISGNRIEHLGEFCDALSKNKTLNSLCMAANPIVPADYAALKDVRDSFEQNEPGRFKLFDIHPYETKEEDYIVKTTETSEEPLLRIK